MAAGSGIYTAAVEFDGEDGILVGQVLGINDIIDCEGQSVQELEQDFHAAINQPRLGVQNRHVPTFLQIGEKFHGYGEAK